MDQAKIVFQNIYCKPVSKEHINSGWLSWMNDPITSQQINPEGRKINEADLEKYLEEKKSIFFLACYTKEGKYFGNVRIHELTSNISSFGRLIGSEKHRGKGYGKLLVELSKSLIFGYKKYDVIISGNNKRDLASANSKMNSGFQKMDQETINALKHEVEFKDGDYYILSRSDYYKNLK